MGPAPRPPCHPRPPAHRLLRRLGRGGDLSPKTAITTPPSGTDTAEQSHQTKGLLRLTMACNERCPFCNVPAEDYPRKTPAPAEIERQLSAFVASGARTLTISGGEPTLLRKRLVALVGSARARGIPYVELQTNAVLITEDYAAELARAGLTSAFVSLLSHIPEDHDWLAGLDGAFARCVAGIDHLLDHGIRVTLNPVLAQRTQGAFADFIGFVVERLPRVRSISVSAVQPHGRAGRGDNTELLLPDYAVLAHQIPEARRRAQAAGIELLNPYCGLPLCIGWTDDPARSVEAVEAAQGGWRPTPGLQNTGDKTQAKPCRVCALRTRCGGAWRAYWTIRGGRGIQAPAEVVPPWSRTPPSAHQTVVDARAGLTEAVLDQCSRARTPTVFLRMQRLVKGEGATVLSSGATDLAVTIQPAGLAVGRAPRSLLRTLRELAVIIDATATAPPQGRLRVWLQLAPAHRADLAAAVAWAKRAGVHRVSRAPISK